MKTMMKTTFAAIIGIAALGVTGAWAKPDICRVNHDHRSHAADYYNYYPADNYSRAGNYRANDRQSGLRISISVGDNDRYDRRDNRYDRRDRNRNNGRVVNREVFDTRYRARIILTEQVVRTRNGPRLVCTVDARGPQAHRVPNKRLRRIARNNCSHRAQIRIVT